MQETWVRSLGCEDPLEKEMATLQYFCLENPMDRWAWCATVHKESDTTEQLSLSIYTKRYVRDIDTYMDAVAVYLLSCVWLFATTPDYRPPGSSVHGISRARILEWVAISFSKGSSWSRDQTCISCIGKQILYHCATWEDQSTVLSPKKIHCTGVCFT